MQADCGFNSRTDLSNHNCSHGTRPQRVRNLEPRLARNGLRSWPMWLIVPAMNISSALGLSPLGPYHSLMYGRSMYFDISKAKRELGWAPKYSNDDMFIESYSWHLQHRTDVLGRSSQGSRHKSAVELRLLKLLGKVLLTTSVFLRLLRWALSK